MSIHFHIQKPLVYELKKQKIIKKWLKEVAKSENKKVKTLTYILCNDNDLHKINVAYLNHDTLTDVITFDNSPFFDENAPKNKKIKHIEGDIFISLDRVKENAKKYKTKTKLELKRVMVHGLLHLIGYADKKTKEQKIMREKENFYLAKFNEIK